MKKFFSFVLGAAAVATLLNGCYDYPKPASSTLGDSYTQRPQEKLDEVFKDMTTLTLQEAQRIALANNPTYIAAYHSVSAARMRYYQALGAYSPTLSAGFGLDRSLASSHHNTNNKDVLRNRGFSTDTSVTAQLLIFDGFARTFKVLAAKHSREFQKRMEEDACRTLMNSVAQAYNGVLLAIAQRRIAEENYKFQKTTLQDTKFKFQAGAVPLSDVLNFEIQMNQADVDKVAADRQYEVSVYALAALMGYPEGTLPDTVSFPTGQRIFAELPAVEIYLDTALANRPDLKAYREKVNIAKYQVYQGYSAYSPTVSGYAKFDYTTNASYYSQSYGYGYTRDYHDGPHFSYGMNADWMIFNGFIRYNQLREFQAELAIADYDVAEQWLTVVSEVRSAYSTYNQSLKANRLYKKMRDLSERQRDLVRDEYKAGNCELTRLNEAQRDLVDAESNLASSHASIENAKAQLDAAVGVNNAEYYKSERSENEIPGLGAVQQQAETAKATPAKTDDDKPAQPKSEEPKPVVPAQPAEKKAAPVKAETKSAEKKASTPAKADSTKPAEKKVAPEIPASPTAAPKKSNN